MEALKQPTSLQEFLSLTLPQQTRSQLKGLWTLQHDLCAQLHYSVLRDVIYPSLPLAGLMCPLLMETGTGLFSHIIEAV